MYQLTRISSRLIFMMLPMIPIPCHAKSTITCHCFTDRSYDSAHPTMADPYFLATTQNSFFAAVFGIEKSTVVVKKQKGFSSDDLWVAYWLATRSGADPEMLMQEHKAKGTWQKVVTGLAMPVKTPGSRVNEALKANAGDARLANAVVDELLLQFRFHTETELTALRKAGAGNQELVLAGLIAAKTRQGATGLYCEVKGGSTSWGALLQRAKLNPVDIQAEVAELVRRVAPRTK